MTTRQPLPDPQPSLAAGAPSRRAQPHFGLLIALTAIGPLSLHVFLPSMPGLKSVFATDAGTIQLVFTGYLVALAVAQLVFGPLSDRFGRRPVTLGGLAIFLLGTVLGLLADGIGLLIVGRILQAIGACAGLVLGRAMVRDLYGRERGTEALAYLTMAMVVVPMVSPAIGGLMDQRFGWQANFWLMFAYGALLAVVSLRFLHETHWARQGAMGSREMLYGFVALMRIRAFRGYAFQTAFTTAAFFAFAGNGPDVAIERMGLSPTEYGVFFMVVSIAFMAGNFGAARLSRRLGGDRMILLGGLIGVVSLSAMAVVTIAGLLGPGLLFAGVAAMALGNGFCLPNATAGAIGVDPRRAGAASGLVGFMQMGMGALASWGVAALGGGGPVVMATTMAACAMLAVLSQLVWVGWPKAPAVAAAT